MFPPTKKLTVGECFIQRKRFYSAGRGAAKGL